MSLTSGFAVNAEPMGPTFCRNAAPVYDTPVQVWTSVIAPLLGAIVGAYAVYRFAVKQMQVKRLNDFSERQLSECYAPMAALQRRLSAHATLSSELFAAIAAIQALDVKTIVRQVAA